ncbi:MAG TPA: hypothetical protein VGP96_09950 [Candidatus Dormibacteraeota bacterium]|nr:hypothetical protein [Candidatus Dormibacteraeota bacterium]
MLRAAAAAGAAASPVPPAPPAARAEPAPPDLHLPVILPPRLELPAAAVAVGAPAARPVSVAGFVAAELRSIPTQWVEDANGRRAPAAPVAGRALIVDGAAAVAVATAPAPRPVASAWVQLVAVPDPEQGDAAGVRPRVPGGITPREAEARPAERPGGWPLAPAAIIRPCPMPEGARLFGPLHSSYIDGPSLLRELGARGHSGALVTAGGGRAQAAILHRGAVVALLATGRSGTRRLENLRLPLAGQEEEHDLTVPVYRPEVALALGQLVNLVARFRRMHASFVRLPALLDHLAESRVTGGVRVVTGSDVGVLLLSEGTVLGGYTARHPALEEPELVSRLCAAEDAEIDVHAAPLAKGLPPALTVARLLG